MSDQKEEQPQEQQTQMGTTQTEKETVTIDISQNQQGPPEVSGPKATLSRYKQVLTIRPIKYDVISIIFALLILGGGVYGYLEKGSTASLIAGIIFGLLLASAAYFEGARKNPYPLLVILVFLLAMFGYRYSVAWKFMPSGLFSLLTAIMVLRNCYIIYIRKKKQAA